MIKTLMVTVMAVVLSACAALDQVEDNPMTAQLVTSQLTLRFIAADDEPVERAAAVRAAVERLQARVEQGPEFTLEEFQALALAEFDFEQLSPADQELVVYGLTLARRTIAELIGDGIVAPDERYTLATVLAWVDQAASRVR